MTGRRGDACFMVSCNCLPSYAGRAARMCWSQLSARGIAYLDLKSENCLIDQQAVKCLQIHPIAFLDASGLPQDDRFRHRKAHHKHEVWPTEGHALSAMFSTGSCTRQTCWKGGCCRQESRTVSRKQGASSASSEPVTAASTMSPSEQLQNTQDVRLHNVHEQRRRCQLLSCIANRLGTRNDQRAWILCTSGYPWATTKPSTHWSRAP